MYNMTLKPKAADTALRSAPEPTAPAVAAPAPTPGTRMKVLDRKGGQVRVRDDRGYEGWVPSDALQYN